MGAVALPLAIVGLIGSLTFLGAGNLAGVVLGTSAVVIGVLGIRRPSGRGLAIAAVIIGVLAVLMGLQRFFFFLV